MPIIPSEFRKVEFPVEFPATVLLADAVAFPLADELLAVPLAASISKITEEFPEVLLAPPAVLFPLAAVSFPEAAVAFVDEAVALPESFCTTAEAFTDVLLAPAAVLLEAEDVLLEPALALVVLFELVEFTASLWR